MLGRKVLGFFCSKATGEGGERLHRWCGGRGMAAGGCEWKEQGWLVTRSRACHTVPALSVARGKGREKWEQGAGGRGGPGCGLLKCPGCPLGPPSQAPLLGRHRPAAAPARPCPVGLTSPPELKILLILLRGKCLQCLFLRNPSLFKHTLDIVRTPFPGDMWTEASRAPRWPCWRGQAFGKCPDSLPRAVSQSPDPGRHARSRSSDGTLRLSPRSRGSSGFQNVTKASGMADAAGSFRKARDHGFPGLVWRTPSQARPRTGAWALPSQRTQPDVFPELWPGSIPKICSSISLNDERVVSRGSC